MNDNKTLRTTHTSQQFVITIMRNGVRKYIDRSFSKNVNCTVLLNRARRFQSEKQARGFLKYLENEDKCEIAPVTVEMRLDKELKVESV